MAADASRPVSGRVLLARLAEQVIAVSDGVSTTPGGDRRWVTADGDRLIEGIVVAETRLGQVDVELHLVVDWPPQPLDQLASHLRRRLTRSASLAGLGDRLGASHVAIHDVREPGPMAPEPGPVGP